MNEIIVRVYTSDQAEKHVINMLEQHHFVAHTANIYYSLEQGLPDPSDTDAYPLILEGYYDRVPTKVMVYSVTAGYGGSGPYALANILKAAGFHFDVEDILTPKCADTSRMRLIKLTYTR